MFIKTFYHKNHNMVGHIYLKDYGLYYVYQFDKSFSYNLITREINSIPFDVNKYYDITADQILNNYDSVELIYFMKDDHKIRGRLLKISKLYLI